MKTALLTPGTVGPAAQLAPVTHEAYEVAPNALAGMRLVKRFGLADMYDREAVIKAVEHMGFREGADWLRANRHLYFVALRHLG